jgi:hypothetical protein
LARGGILGRPQSERGLVFEEIGTIVDREALNSRLLEIDGSPPETRFTNSRCFEESKDTADGEFLIGLRLTVDRKF